MLHHAAGEGDRPPVWVNVWPPRSKVPPLAKMELAAGSELAPLIVRLPGVTVVAPLKLLLPVSVNVPLPFIVRLPLPLMLYVGV